MLFENVPLQGINVNRMHGRKGQIVQKGTDTVCDLCPANYSRTTFDQSMFPLSSRYSSSQ